MTCISVIVAVADNGVIGRNNALPWHLPEDLRYFKRVTMGKPIVMGRKTFESIGRPLPGRTNIVISRDPGFAAAGVEVVASLDAALQLAEEPAAGLAGEREVVVIGGAEIYGLAIPRADRLYVTEVHAEPDGDALLPAVAWDGWVEMQREDHQADGTNTCDYSFVVYGRAARG
jgi:dihydrofolate reductase